jgi:hypothetical protein
MVVGRAVPGAVQQFQPGMLFEVRGDLAGMVNAVVIADHHDHRARGNAWSGDFELNLGARLGPAEMGSDPSVMLDRFMLCLPLSAGLRRRTRPPRGLGDAAVNDDLLHDQVGDAVIGLQRGLLEPGEDPGLGPFVAAFPDRGGRAGAVGSVRALAARAADQGTGPGSPV